MGNKGNVYHRFARIPEGKRPLVTPKHRIEDNIKIDNIKLIWVGVNWLLWLRIVTNDCFHEANEHSDS